MSDDKFVESNNRRRVRKYDVGLCPTIIVQVVNGRLYSADVEFDDLIAFVGNPDTGKVVELTELERMDEVEDLDVEGRFVADAARIAGQIGRDATFRSDLLRIVKEAITRCA